jgi:hypothetical protein
LDYRLSNNSYAEEPFLWALHPLLRLQAGDRLDLPHSTRALLPGSDWIDAVDSMTPEGGCAKVFAEGIAEGRASLRNERTGDCLTFEWSPDENDTLGLWLTRGGWHGHQHFAIEPTNGAPDRLTEAAGRKRCGIVPARGSRTWSVILRVGP